MVLRELYMLPDYTPGSGVLLQASPWVRGGVPTGMVGHPELQPSHVLASHGGNTGDNP